MDFEKNETKEINHLTLLVATLKMDDENNFRIPYLNKIIASYRDIKDFQNYIGTFDKPLTDYLEVLKRYQYLVDKIDEPNAYRITMKYEKAQQIIWHVKRKTPVDFIAVYLLKDAILNNDHTILLGLAKLNRQNKENHIQSIDDFFVAFFCSLRNQKLYVFDVTHFEEAFGFSFFDSEKVRTFLSEIFQKPFEAVDMNALMQKLMNTPIYPEKAVSPGYLERRNIGDFNFFMNVPAKTTRFVNGLNEQDKEALNYLTDMYLNYKKSIKNDTSVVK